MNSFAYPNYGAIDQPISYRKLAVWCFVFAHVGVLCACLLSKHFNPQASVYLVFGLVTSCFASVLAFAKSSSRVLHFMVAWFFATFTLKLISCVSAPADTTLAGLAERLGTGFSVVVAEKYAYFTFGLASMVLCSMVLPFIFPTQNKNYIPAALPATDQVFAWVRNICIVTLAFQVIAYFVLRVGRASIVPPVILFPGVAGFIAMLSEIGGLIVVTSLLALSISRKTLFSLATGSSLAVVFIGISIAAGWKRALFQVVLCLVWYYTFLAGQKLRARLKPLILTFGVLAVLLYFPVMAIRNLVVYEGLSPVNAAKQLVDPEVFFNQEYGKVFTKITDRFNGLELFTISSHAFEDQKLGLAYLINGQFGRIFTHDVMGASTDAVTAQGSTLWGFFSAVLGAGAIWVCGVFIAVVIFVGEGFCAWLSRDMGAILTAEFALIMWLIGMVGSSGAFVLFAKRAAVSVAVLLILNKFAWGSRSMKEQTQRWSMQWQPQMYHPR